jgi:uncharacterized protein YceH (UPF0502 family)
MVAMAALELTPLEARVLGVLIEKEMTTPESYPLSLNALVAGCNQKSNRDPVLSVVEREVNDAILNLRVAGLIEFVQLIGQRVEKYRHRAGTALSLEPPELAVLAELLLRGPQQPGELRGRADRMQPFPALESLQPVLASLSAKGLAGRIERREGERTGRWAQLLTGTEVAVTSPPPVASAAGIAPSAPFSRSPEASLLPPPPAPAAPRPAAPPADVHAALAALDARVARLETMVSELLARST